VSYVVSYTAFGTNFIINSPLKTEKNMATFPRFTATIEQSQFGLAHDVSASEFAATLANICSCATSVSESSIRLHDTENDRIFDIHADGRLELTNNASQDGTTFELSIAAFSMEFFANFGVECVISPNDDVVFLSDADDIQLVAEWW
jgi:translation initiation factor 1 (eIF-1/SUI1)